MTKILATKWRMDIDKKDIGNHVNRESNSPALSVPKTSQAVAAHKKEYNVPIDSLNI
jgi:hypothetical protein